MGFPAITDDLADNARLCGQGDDAEPWLSQFFDGILDFLFAAPRRCARSTVAPVDGQSPAAGTVADTSARSS
jgi:hypothetical protein